MKKALGLDIGGTNFRVAIFEEKNNQPNMISSKVYSTKEMHSLIPILHEYKDVEQACIAFAGPIVNQKASLTNADLTIDAQKIKQKTHLTKIDIVNDFHSNGYGVLFLNEHQVQILHKGNNNEGIKIIIGPGTGLGKAHLINQKVYPSEGGLTLLPSQTEDEFNLYKKIPEHYKYYEDILSGRGISYLYDHIKTGKTRVDELIAKEPHKKSEIITQTGEHNHITDQVLKTFTSYYARYIRDAALHVLCSDIYLVGNISIALQKYLQKHLLEEFFVHRKYTSMLKKVNIHLVLTPDVGLIGAGAIALDLTKHSN